MLLQRVGDLLAAVGGDAGGRARARLLERASVTPATRLSFAVAGEIGIRQDEDERRDGERRQQQQRQQA